MNLNEFRGAGNLTRDPELKYTAQRSAMLAFRAKFRSDDGENWTRRAD